MRILTQLLVLVVFSSASLVGQVPHDVKSGDRPVFMSAQRLALLCEDWNAVNPGGRPPKNSDTLEVSEQQIVRAFSCESYILGVNDQQATDAYGTHYHPLQSRLDYMKPLIDTFLKYVRDHPEEQDFAASTVLNQTVQIIVKAQRSSNGAK